MKNVKRVAACLVIVTGLLFFGCNHPQEGSTFKVGVIAPLTGEGANYGDAMKNGIDLAIGEINSGGGYQGEKIEAVYEDDKFSVTEAIKGFNYLKDVSKVPVIFGSAASGVSKALAPLADQNKIVLFSSISTSDSLKFAGPYFFRNISANAMEARTVAGFLLNRLKLKNVGVFYENNEYGLNMNAVFKQEFKGNIVFNQPYEFKQADFRNSIAAIKPKSFDAVFVQGTTWGIAMLVKQLRDNQITCPVITGDGGYGDEIKTIAGSSANGLFCTLPAIEDTLSANYVKFKSAFTGKYHKNPDIYSVYSYDAVMMVFQAIKDEKIDAVTGEVIKDKLSALAYTGLGGTYKFDQYGGVDIPFSIFQYNNKTYTKFK
jgi:branched-chain amino acid transport system substrate-binding protein